MKNLSEAVVVNSSGKTLARSQLSFSLGFNFSNDDLLKGILNGRPGEVIIITNQFGNTVRAGVKLEAFFDAYLFRNAATAFTVGLCLTVMVQSSSITTSLIVPLAGAGVLRLQQIFPFTIGANIGTTITGLLAALAAASAVTVMPGEEVPQEVVAGATVAFAHLLFNCAGAIIFLPFAPIRNLPVKFAEWLAELCLKNRFIPIAFIAVFFYLIPIIVTWNTIAAVFNK